MKRTIVVVLVVLVLAVGALVAGLLLAPRQLEQLWRTAGLPGESFQPLVGILPETMRPISVSVPVALQPTTVMASGTLEAIETRIASEVPGQVVDVAVEEGQTVDVGQSLVQIDSSLLQAQLSEAEQGVEVARANLKAAQAGPRQAEMAAAEAVLRQARAGLDGAQKALASARQARDELQEIDLQLHAAQAHLAQAQRAIEVARARRSTVRVLSESVAGDGSDEGKTQAAIYEKQAAAADEQFTAAEVEAQGAQRLVAFLQRMRDDPVALDVQVRAAEGQVRLAEEDVRLAEAELALASAGPRAPAIALAEAQLVQAQAAYDLLQAQAKQYKLLSPLAGVVTMRAVDAGETIAAGVPLLTVADLGEMTLVIYVPEPRIGAVQLGRPARVHVDAYPGRSFPGTVSHISAQAEFTPKNIQAPEERVETVFAVEIALPNPDKALKPGMPADAEILGRASGLLDSVNGLLGGD